MLTVAVSLIEDSERGRRGDRRADGLQPIPAGTGRARAPGSRARLRRGQGGVARRGESRRGASERRRARRAGRDGWRRDCAIDWRRERDATEEDLLLYEAVARYFLFQRHDSEWWALITRGEAGERTTVRVPGFARFAADVAEFLAIPGVSFPFETDAAHLFAWAFRCGAPFTISSARSSAARCRRRGCAPRCGSRSSRTTCGATGARSTAAWATSRR